MIIFGFNTNIMISVDLRKKLEQVLIKSEDLILEKKYYEYSQKIKLLANRKLQTKKPEESIVLLQGGAKRLLEMQQIQEGYELLSKWVSVYEENEKLFDQAAFDKLLEIYLVNSKNRSIQIFERIINRFYILIKEFKNFERLLTQISDQLIAREQYWRAQKYIVHLDLPRAKHFLSAWISKLEKHDIIIVENRFILLKIVHGKTKEAHELIQDLPAHALMFNSLKLKSKEALLRLKKDYSYFLENQKTFERILDEIGSGYFGLQKNQKKGLLNLLG